VLVTLTQPTRFTSGLKQFFVTMVNAITGSDSNSDVTMDSAQMLEVANGIDAPTLVPLSAPVAPAVEQGKEQPQNTDGDDNDGRGGKDDGFDYTALASQSIPRDFPLSPPRRTTELISDDKLFSLDPPDSSPEPDLPDIAELISRTRPNSQRLLLTPRSSASNVSTRSQSKGSSVRTSLANLPLPESPLGPRMRRSANGTLTPRPQGMSLASSSSPGKRNIDTFPSPSGPPMKRSKNMSTNATKHEKWWLLDGNVVLQINQIQFKLHRSFLTRQSSFFEKLFRGEDMGPLAYTENADSDGRSLFHILCTCATDFERLLEVLDNALYVFFFSTSFQLLININVVRIIDSHPNSPSSPQFCGLLPPLTSLFLVTSLCNYCRKRGLMILKM
jgi:hypothetical protein